MKKKIKYILFIILCNIFIGNVYAANANISVAPSKKNVQVGQTFTVSVSISSPKKDSNYALGSWQFNVGYDSNVFQFVSSTLENGLSSTGVVSNATTYNKSYTLTFKAKAAGTGKITVNNVEIYSINEDILSASDTGTTVTVTDNSKSNDNSDKSADNYLSSLSINGYDLTPTFNKNTTSYSLSLPNDVNSIEVSAKTNDSKASVTGTGNISLAEGTNKVKVTVTAENGNKKTYTINVNVQEKEPIKVKIGDDEYTVAQKLNDVSAPTTYVNSSVSIDGRDIPAFKSDISKYTLVGLVSKSGDINLYIYSNDQYEKYKEYKFNGVILFVKKPSELPKNAKEEELTINGDSILVYKIKDNSYPLIYGLNVETGEENFYTYDSSENTLQKYVVGNKNSTTEVTKLSDKNVYTVSDKKFETLAYILCGLTGMLFMFLAISAIKMSIQNEYKIRG